MGVVKKILITIIMNHMKAMKKIGISANIAVIHTGTSAV
jgi:hypothetical protein